MRMFDIIDRLVRAMALVWGFVSVGPAAAQGSDPGCQVEAATPRRVELPDGRAVSTDVQSVAVSDGSVMAVGRLAYVFPLQATPRTSPVVMDSIIGFVIDRDGHVSLVPNPPGVRRPFFPRVAAASAGAFHALFVTSVDTANRIYGHLDTATIWYARFRQGAWTSPERVGEVRNALLQSEFASDLLARNDSLSFVFAFSVGEYTPMTTGGVVLLRRRGHTWLADTLHTVRGPTSAVLAFEPGRNSVATAITIPGTGNRAGSSLYLARFDRRWDQPRRIAGDGIASVTAPIISAVGEELVASWIDWKWMDAGSSRLSWLRIGAQDSMVARPIASGGSTYLFEVAVIGGRYPLWLHRGETYGTTMALAMALDSTIVRPGVLTVPFENPRARAAELSPARLLVLTMKQGKLPDEPMVASYATMLEFRCPMSVRRE